MSENKKPIYYNYRHIARVTVEADTPIAVGSGKTDISTDSPVIRDVNGLPYIPATSMAGILRHALGIKDSEKNLTFGYHDSDGGRGSCIIFTDAVMVGKEGCPLDGLQNKNINWEDDFYAHYREMNIRQHVRINEMGVAANAGKFDNEVVFKGTRFTFEMELYSEASQRDAFDHVLSMLYAETLRVGSGTRCGYGKLRVVTCERADLDLSQPRDLKAYAEKSSRLSSDWKALQRWKPAEAACLDAGKWHKYVVELHPRDFFLFGAGMGDVDADNIPVSDVQVEWGDDGVPTFSKRKVLIPATSVKGALAHRTAYHYNKLCGQYADKMEESEMKLHVGGCNEAVAAIFGMSCEDEEKKRKSRGDGSCVDNKERLKGSRGNIILSDVMWKENKQKVFFHIKNDTFTGGTIPGALFQEKCVYGRGDTLTLEILVNESALKDDNIKEAFEQSLKDLCDGLLPLGGVTGRGNGMFTGTYNKEKNDGANR